MAEGLCGDVGGTITPPAYTLNVTENGTYPASQYSQVVVNVGGGGGGGAYKLIASEEVEVASDYASLTSIATITPNEATRQTGKIVYVKIRNKSGKGTEMCYGSDNWFIDLDSGNGSANTQSMMSRTLYNINNVNKFQAGSTSAYPVSSAGGVSVKSVKQNGDIEIGAKYSSPYHIPGTYVVEVYLLSWPGDVSPLE